MNQPATYNKAVETIKTAILQGQYEAAKGVEPYSISGVFRYWQIHLTQHPQGQMGYRRIGGHQPATSERIARTTRVFCHQHEEYAQVL